jgi:hypothetical protein
MDLSLKPKTLRVYEQQFNRLCKKLDVDRPSNNFFFEKDLNYNAVLEYLLPLSIQNAKSSLFSLMYYAKLNKVSGKYLNEFRELSVKINKNIDSKPRE